LPPRRFLSKLRVEAATLAAANKYRPDPYDGPLTLFVANEAAM